MSFIKKITYKTKKHGVYEIKQGVRKKWTTFGLREKEKRKEKKIKTVTWVIRKTMQYIK